MSEVLQNDPLISRLKNAGVEKNLILEVELRLKDNLTGLPRGETCRWFSDDLLASGKKVVMEFDDLRFLKTFNTRTGFVRTNNLIRDLGHIYRDKVDKLRQRGVTIEVGRYGGDEFLIVVGDKTKKEAKPILDEIHHALKQIKKPHGAFFKPHFSRGIVGSDELPDEKRNTATLLEWADRRKEKDKKTKFKYIKERAERKENKPTKKFLEKIQRYA